VDEGHEPERIEIELTAHEPAAPAGRTGRVQGGLPDGASVETTDPDDVGRPGLLGTEQGRLVAVAATAAVLALLVGVLVGRMGSGDVESADDLSSTTTEVTTTTRPPGNRDTLPRAPEILAPTTTRPERATTTTIDPEQMVEGSIDINPVVTPEKAEIIALTRQGVVVRIDAITGSTVSTQASAQFGQAFVSAGDGWVLVPSDDGGSSVIADDGSRSTLDLGEWWPPLMAGSASAFWRSEIDRQFGFPTRLVGVAIDGSETGVVIELDGHYPQMLDPLGGVVVQAPGGFYVVRAESRAHLTAGQLIALGERRALVYECDDRLECGYFVVDRTTGTADRLEVDPELGERPPLGWVGWWSLVEPLSPNEEAVVVAAWNGQAQSLGVLDLTTGSYTELGTFDNEPQAAWGPGSRYLYWLDGGRIMVFDRSTGESVVFSEDLDSVAALTVRGFVGSTVGSADQSG